jgi:hypothetical protein
MESTQKSPINECWNGKCRNLNKKKASHGSILSIKHRNWKGKKVPNV